VTFTSLQEFLAMGGHGFEVWTSWALGAVIVVALLLRPLRARRRFFAEEKRRLAREAGSANATEDRDGNASTTA
jgi:heme exporter protein D